MREIFERHAERLTREERRVIWERASGSSVRESRGMRRWAPRAAVAVAMAVAVVAVLRREPADLDRSAVAGRDPATARIQGSAPAPDRTPPLADRPRAPAGREVAPPRAAVDRGGLGGHEETRPVDVAAKPERVAEAAPAPAESTVRALVARQLAALAAPPPPAPIAIAALGVVTGRITDSQNRPVAFANVDLMGARKGAVSAEDGTYRIDRMPPAVYTLRVRRIGASPELREGIRVEAGQATTVDVQVGDAYVVKTLDEVEIRAEKRIDVKSSSTRQSISAERLRGRPVDNLRDAVRAKSGVVTQGGDVHFRGGRSNEVRVVLDGSESSSPLPVVIPTTGGSKLPNDEPYDSMFFKSYGVNPFIPTDEDALSTFAVDVDAASYTITRRYLELGHLPPGDAVRVEEFVNFFPQGYPSFRSEDFRIVIDGAPSPFGAGYHLLRIGIKGREIEERNRKPAQLTFVIDVSGSMDQENRLELVKAALRLLVSRLHGDDRVGIVVYGSQGRVLLEPVAVGGKAARDGRRSIVEAIDRLHPEGSTNAEEGLRLGYEMARRGYRPGAINRIVLCSDGVANVGMTGPQSILESVRSEAHRGIHLTTIGFGMGNYNDVLMEQLADRGDGNHYYVDDIVEAHRVFVENLTGTLQTIAKDAKVQVEFDSTRVVRYRLLGFENRDVADRDFRNDRVDAGEIGAGHEVTALYEVKLAPGITQGTLATVRLRYARPEQEGAGAPQVREIQQRFDAGALGRKFEDAAPRFRLDAAVAELAEILRGSYWAKEGRLSDVLSVARSAARDLRDETSAEFVSLVEKAAALSRRAKPGEPEGER